MGMPVEGPTFIFNDNQLVLANLSRPDSVLRKKENSVVYHFIQEGTAADEWCITYINTNDTLADLLTKPLGGGCKSWIRLGKCGA
eukprot:1505639-Ditylum_brightwellii.AAC.1